MVRYNADVQEIADFIKEYNVVASGTITVGTNQYPTTTLISKPPKLYRNYVLFAKNKTGLSITNISPLATNGDSILPNALNTEFANNSTLSTPMTWGNNVIGIIALNSYYFALGKLQIQFNLSTTPTSGTIDWVLIGY